MEFPENPAEWTPEQWQRLEAFLAERQDLVAAIRALAAKGGPLWHLDFEQGFQLPLPHLSILRDFARILDKDAQVQGRVGNWDAVSASIAAQIQLADAVGTEPVLISQLLSYALDDIARGTLRDAVPPGMLSDTQLATLLHALDARAERSSMAGAIAMEMRFGSISFDQIRSGDTGVMGGEVHPIAARLLSSSLGQMMVSLDEAAYLDIMAPLAELARLPYYEAAQQIPSFEAASENLPFYKPLTRVLIPALTPILVNQSRNEAVVGLMRLGLLVEQHHARHGSYPTTIGGLGVAYIDPFTGDPYRYLPSGDSFRLYSVGQNLSDDGGTHSSKPGTGDIVWRGRQSRQLDPMSSQRP